MERIPWCARHVIANNITRICSGLSAQSDGRYMSPVDHLVRLSHYANFLSDEDVSMYQEACSMYYLRGLLRVHRFACNRAQLCPTVLGRLNRLFSERRVLKALCAVDLGSVAVTIQMNNGHEGGATERSVFAVASISA